MSDIGIKVCIKRADKPESLTAFPRITVYKPETPGVHKHPREVDSYVSKDSDGSIIIERTDGKRTKLVLP
jgi:hypothetical protein